MGYKDDGFLYRAKIIGYPSVINSSYVEVPFDVINLLYFVMSCSKKIIAEG